MPSEFFLHSLINHGALFSHQSSSKCYLFFSYLDCFSFDPLFIYLFKCFLCFTTTLQHYIFENIYLLCFVFSTKKLKMLHLIGKYRSRSSRQYQKLGHDYEKVTTRTKKYNWGKKLEARSSKGFRLNRPRRFLRHWFYQEGS